LWLKWFIPGHEDFHDFTAIPKNIQNLLLNDPAELLNHPELAGVKRDIEYVAAHTDPATRRFSVTVNSWKEVRVPEMAQESWIFSIFSSNVSDCQACVVVAARPGAGCLHWTRLLWYAACNT
jgi:hypothetical protein